ncbi:MAG: hypothetical protein F4121_09090 [Acidimicrobiia bacterium]|nr:hypothetical protein [Acidimicrobiia bacterium]MYC44057.1 hypothetical protein [Acidimicrobiia bacterium]MYI20206.1 hypothetical protein [Acidimicrobiia bacterium]
MLTEIRVLRQLKFALVSGVFWLGIDSIHHRRGWLPQRVERPSIDVCWRRRSHDEQETYVKLEDLHKQGWTIKEIATETD